MPGSRCRPALWRTSTVALDRSTAQSRRPPSAAGSATAMVLAEQQRRNRADRAAVRIREGKALAALQVEKTAKDGERRKVEADLGPVRYLATLIGATDEATMRGFILAVALLLEPAAVVLLLAATGPSAK
jgi:hypothetical protein